MINVTYSITFDFNKFYTESEVTYASPVLLSQIAQKPTVEGAITISIDDDTQTVNIVDEVVPWIQNLCFRAISDLAYDIPVTVNYFSRSGVLELTPIGDQLKLTGSLTPPAIFPKIELLEALIDCGQRFIESMKKLKQNDADYMANLEYVVRFVEPAKSSLKMIKSL